MPDIDFPAGDGTTPGYLAVPAGERGPATIVLQEWWGLDEHIRSICDRLAAEGFYALAPDLYRGETTAQPSEASENHPTPTTKIFRRPSRSPSEPPRSRRPARVRA